ncbi:MAG: hypothetical protein ACRC6X_00120 [Culicoidibacterales bacterium]
MEKEIKLFLRKIDAYEFYEAEKIVKKKINSKKFKDNLIDALYDSDDFNSGVPLFFQELIERNDGMEVKMYCHEVMSLFWFFSYNYIRGAAMNDLYHMKKILELDSSNEEMITYVNQLSKHPDYCDFIKNDLFLASLLSSDIIE